VFGESEDALRAKAQELEVAPKEVSRPHGASVFGPAVGAMGVAVFVTYLPGG
jgi:hypothetical protein